VLAVLVLASPAGAASFPVDVTTDPVPDAPATSNGCQAAGGDECTLREAILAANATAGSDSIGFSIPNDSVIDIDFAGQGVLPSVTQQVTIGTGSGFIDAEINGPGPGGPADPDRNGLHLTAGASGSQIRAMSIVDFDNGVMLDGADNVTVDSNRIGRRANGNALGNGNAGNEFGIVASGDANGNAISFNQIMANSNGIALNSAADLTTIDANFIGIDGAATAGLGNTFDGVAAGGAPDTTISNNIVGNNGDNAIITAGPRAVIRGNSIGTVSSIPAPNGAHGILVASNGGSATIGGPTQPDGNVIVGSGAVGVKLEGSLGNNVLQNNTIGSSSTGDPLGDAARNDGGGVVVNKGPGNRIGTPGAGNRISDNGNEGILVEDTLPAGAAPSGTRIESNVIGAGGGNATDGIEVDDGATGTVIGAPGAGNAVMSNGAHGIQVTGGTNTTVQANRVGVDDAGDSPRGNVDDGISVSSTPGTVVGGLGPGEGNVSAANGERGIDVENGSDDTIVRGNLVGTNAAGTLAFPNDQGIRIEGDRVLVERNTIAGNVTEGIQLDDGDAIRAEGNNIGRTAGGAAMPNGAAGIDANNGVTGTVGGPGAASNTIASNLGDGVFVNGTTPQLTVAENAISGNGGLGIDLGTDGVTANDAGDGDSGANALQNAPEVSSAVASGGQTAVTGSLGTTPSTPVTVRFFASSACDASGRGEGERFLGATAVTTDGAGNAGFGVTLPATAVGEQVTATATGPGGTSEFSSCRAVEAPPSPAIGVATISPPSASVAEGGLASFEVSRSGSTAQDALVFVTSADGSARAGADYDALDTAVFFDAGETTKTVSLATRQDTAAEGGETLTVSLRSPVRVGLGDPSSTSLTIAGNDRVPDTNIKTPKSQRATRLKTLTGTASDADGDLSRVEVAIFQKVGSRRRPACRNINSKGNAVRGKVDSKRRCRPTTFLRASGTEKWSFKLRKTLPKGTWTIATRATDRAGLRETTFSKSDRNQVGVKLN
jgi:CSLREA domain-containing protein